MHWKLGKSSPRPAIIVPHRSIVIVYLTFANTQRIQVSEVEAPAQQTLIKYDPALSVWHTVVDGSKWLDGKFDAVAHEVIGSTVISPCQILVCSIAPDARAVISEPWRPCPLSTRLAYLLPLLHPLILSLSITRYVPTFIL